MMTSSSVYVLFIDDGGYLAPVAKAPYDGGQRNQAIVAFHQLVRRISLYDLFYISFKPGDDNGSTCGKKGYFTWHKKLS
jgi:hypothetical protein